MKLIIPKDIGLYVHLPWCVKKCPYCDFNSHQLRVDLDEQSYIDALLKDFEFEMNRFDQARSISSIFIGGGTPSLFSGESIDKLLKDIKKRCEFTNEVEITLEANPGASDESRFQGYRQAGVNRLSIGIQSFNELHLKALGRIHDSDQAVSAIEIAKAAGYDNFNLDLMYCLPGQTVEQAEQDVRAALALSPTHISAYHLTIEPNTLFSHQPPQLPEETISWEIQQQYWFLLEEGGYQKYEISAYCKSGYESKHNLNYWQFGDYVGIGAGAHGKITMADGIYRTLKPKHPQQYLRAFSEHLDDETDYISKVDDIDLPLEYMMNKLRLDDGFVLEDFELSTGLDRSTVTHQIIQAVEGGLLIETDSIFKPSEKGRLFLDDLLQLFLTKRNEELTQCFG